MNYLGHPHKVSKYIVTLPFQFNFAEGTAIVVEGTLDNKITYTTVDDIANVVAGAVDYQGEWPAVGGIRGDSITIGELLKIGERVLGEKLRILTKPLKPSIVHADTMQANPSKSSGSRWKILWLES